MPKAKSKKLSNRTHLIALLAIVLVAVVAIGGTLAYMTDSETKTNIFSVGDLDITLTELNFDPDDALAIVPGDTFEKDPTITLEADSNDAYVRFVVSLDTEETAKDIEERDFEKIVYQYTAVSALVYGQNDDLVGARVRMNTGAYLTEAQLAEATITTTYYPVGLVYENHEILQAGESVTLFEGVLVPTWWNQTQLQLLGDFKIIVTAEAVQADNFVDATAAFTALDGEIANILFEYDAIGAVPTSTP
jgi:predicted ribosomally synthesized peptide with SipW-like signal peptide